MSEEAPQQQTNEYIEQHPGAIVDPVKAEIMASASKIKEEEVVEARTAALDAASNIGNRDYHLSDGYTALEKANFEVSKARNARRVADGQSQAAADIYDTVKKL